MISHGTKEISDRILAAMARQMGITSPQMKDIVRGEISREDYYHLLHERGWLE